VKGNQQEGQSGYVEHERIEDIIRIHIVQSKKVNLRIYIKDEQLLPRIFLTVAPHPLLFLLV
jgi:hypothetical protein